MSLAISPQSSLNFYPSYETIWDTVKELSPYSLEGKCDVNWRDLIMYTGTVFAVIGCAQAFFSGAVFYGFGYAFLGMVTLFGSYYVKKYPTLLELQEVITNLRDVREELQVEVDGLHEENTLLTTNIANLEAEIGNIRTENVHFMENNQQLQTEIRDMQTANTQITENLAQLHTTRTQLEEERGRLDRVRADLAQVRVDFANTHGDYRTELDTLQTIRGQLVDVRAAFATEKQQFEGIRRDLRQELLNLSTQVRGIEGTARNDHLLRQQVQALTGTLNLVLRELYQPRPGEPIILPDGPPAIAVNV